MAAPLILSTTPANGGVNQYLNVHLTVTFDQAMLESSISSNTLLLYRSSDYSQQEGVITYDSSTYIATFIPVKSLDETSAYTFIIVGVDQSADCVKNAASETLATSGLSNFTTGSDIYEPPQDYPDATNPDDSVAPAPTEKVLEPEVSLDFVITDTNPDHRQTNVGTAIPLGWTDVNSPNGRVYIPEASGDTSIYVTFNNDLWPAGVAYLDWITIEAEPVNGDPMFPAAVPSGNIASPSGSNTLYWEAADPSGWYQNNEIIVTVSKYVMDASGDYLGDSQQFMFTTAFNPLYCSISKIRMAIGPYIREVPDDTINRAIFNNSLLAYQLANETYGQDQWEIEDPSFAAKMYVCCKTQYDLLNAELLNRIGSAGQLKRLGDFTVQDQLDLSKAMKPAMDQAEACMSFWVDRLVGKEGKAHPKMAVKGVSSRYTPPMRGVRTWTKSSTGLPAGNTRIQRTNKLPNIYSRWS